MGGQPGFMCKVWTWIEAIQVETLTQNYLSPLHQRAQRPARKCARCESPTETYINVHDHIDSWSRCLWCISLAKSLQEFAAVLQNLEDERTRMVSFKLKSNTNSVLTGLIFPFIHKQNHKISISCACVSLQIENANDVLIMPLERFRKEQISAAKVRRCLSTH